MKTAKVCLLLVLAVVSADALQLKAALKSKQEPAASDETGASQWTNPWDFSQYNMNTFGNPFAYQQNAQTKQMGGDWTQFFQIPK